VEEGGDGRVGASEVGEHRHRASVLSRERRARDGQVGRDAGDRRLLGGAPLFLDAAEAFGRFAVFSPLLHERLLAGSRRGGGERVGAVAAATAAAAAAVAAGTATTSATAGTGRRLVATRAVGARR